MSFTSSDASISMSFESSTSMLANFEVDQGNIRTPSNHTQPGGLDGFPAAPQVVPVPPLIQVSQIAAEFSGARRPRVYQVMPRLGGRFRFICRGRCVTGPAKVDFKFNLTAWLCILLPTTFYFAVCSRELYNLTPWLPVITANLFGVTISLLLLTSFTDPGIIPRHSMRLVVPGLKEKVAHAIGCEDVPTDISSVDYDPVVMDMLEPRGYRWCPFCNMIQPPRAKHCRDCDVCILRNDHHCPFVNNCIGQRNYAFFCAFLVSVVFLGMSVFSGIALWLSQPKNADHKAKFFNDPLHIVMLFVIGGPTALLLLGVFGLSCFHVVLICKGRTTREMLTGKRVVTGATLFGFRGASLVNGRGNVSFPEEEQ